MVSTHSADAVVRALVVEDDPGIGADIVRGLTAAGFAVDLAIDGEEAWYAGDTEDYAVGVVDVGLPAIDGLTVVKRWREAGRDFPVVILSARGDWTEKVRGIEAGADDYMAKPFAMEELVTRVRAVLRRTAGHATPVLHVGSLSVDTACGRVLRDNQELNLTPLEYRLVNYLAHLPSRAASPGEIADQLYGAGDGNDTNAIEALVKRLRRKIGPDAIETRRGFGYILTGTAPA